MKSAWGLRPEGDYQRCLQQFDLREIDAPDQRSLFHLKYYDRLTKILAAIRHYCPPGANILEIGCAQANASLLLAEAGYLAVGLDLHQQALQYARRKYERGRFHSLVGWAEALPLAANAFDAAILGELLEHCADPHSVIRQACAVVKPEGILVITTPNGNYLGDPDPLYQRDLLSPTRPRSRHLVQPGETHLFVFNHRSLTRLLAECNLQILRSGYSGSVAYSDKLRVFKNLLPIRWLELLSSLISKLPWLNRLLSYTLVVVCRKSKSH